MEYNKSPDEAVRKWFKIENEEPLDEKIQIEDNPVGFLCHNIYNNEQWMLYLEDERKARLFEVTETEETKVKKALKIILEEYNDIVS